MDKVKSGWLAIIVGANHICTRQRDIKDTARVIVYTIILGSFMRDAALCSEFVSLINLKD
jgi:GTP cyclohydrolase IA